MTDLKRFMAEREVSPNAMAEIAGVTPRTIANWTSGFKTPPLSFHVLIAGVEAGSITMDWWREQAKSSKGEQ